ncbi:Glucose--fructose oxidoreductase precursor [Planctomycetes bacterium CA13]|uniref:Glucose--fructose oxidoreductase n=1 Tax=Novipirellula herctigrandis TaxID=2527986 RepID=A0A5C5YNG4_9BACT|nr:Glucose--fructose oxidoreductase precursor [Planctomycetes bacterium CA13]
MTNSICRWGFLGSAAIARKNWKAVHLSGNGRVAAVASRSVARAKKFIDECSAEVPPSEPTIAMESYRKLIESPNIDAVYVPLPTGIRKPWVIAAAEAGKHVLCEKPIAINADEAREMIDACAASNVQFMDGVMFDHGERIQTVCNELIDQKSIGTLRRIHSHFSFPSDDAFAESNIRANRELEPHGCLGDLGWYCIRFSLWLAGLELPRYVSARTLESLGEDPVPGEFSGELFFANGLSATFYCSFLSGNQQTAIVSGSDGFLTIDDFVLPFLDGQTHWATHKHDLQIDNCRWNFRKRTSDESADEYAAGESNAQEVNMVRRLAAAAIENKVDTRFSELALKTQMILDACRRSAIADGERVSVPPL